MIDVHSRLLLIMVNISMYILMLIAKKKWELLLWETRKSNLHVAKKEGMVTWNV